MDEEHRDGLPQGAREPAGVAISDAPSIDGSSPKLPRPQSLAMRERNRRVAQDDARAYILHILDRELLLTLRGVELGSQRDTSMRELTRTAATLYEGRILRELIQNAYDGSGRDEGAEVLLRLDLSRGAGVVEVANTGTGFLPDNVDAIVNPALSSKRPGNSIGHKGLGFRSVELVSDDPQIYSMAGLGRPGLSRFDGHCFRFADEQAQTDRLRQISSSDRIEEVAGRTHRLQLPIPIDEQDAAVSAFAREGFASLVRLPLRDGLAARHMNQELEGLFTARAPLALFLNRLARLTIESIAVDGTVERRTINRARRPHPDLDGVDGLEVDVVTTEGRRHLIARREVARDRFMAAVQAAIDEQFPVEKWLEWEGAPVVSVAFGLDADAPGGLYYAFLPTEMDAPFHGFVDAPFFPNPDRRDLSLANPLNAMLLDVAAELCLSLTQGIAASNASTADLVHAAVDALAWRTEAARVFRALDAKGGARGGLMLPAMRRPTQMSRWARLDEIFEWPDEDYRAIKSSWLTKACGVPILRRNLGARRTERLAELAESAGYTLDPWPALLGTWLPTLAQDLSKRRAATRQDWENYYHDVSRMTSVHTELHGKSIFRGSDGKLAAANAADGSGGQFFIVAQAQRTGRSRRRLEGGDVYPPAGITKNMTFADSTLAWPAEVADAFVAAKLASDFSLPKILGTLGKLLGEKPTAKRQAAALTWAFAAWRENRRPDVEAALKTSGLKVPAADGELVHATSARFSRGWRNSVGDRLSAYCDEVAPQSKMVAQLKTQLLPQWDEWTATNPGAAADWTEFLRLIGVRDGLAPACMKAEEHGVWFWHALREDSLEKQPFESTVGPHFRAAARQASDWFRYVTKTYSTTDTLWVLPGQAFHHTFSPAAKHAFAQLVVAMLRDAPSGWFSTVLKKTDGNYDTVTWPSPMAAFLKLAPWLPLAGAEDFEGAPPSDCWFAPRTELPRFMRRIERGVRDQIESSPGLQKLLAETLGMPLWSDATKGADKVAGLGRVFPNVPEGEHDSFRKAYREAWLQWWDTEKRQALPSAFDLVVEIGGRLAPLHVAKSGGDAREIHVADGASPMLEQLLSALGSPVLHVPTVAADGAIAALEAATGATLRRIDPKSLGVSTDGAAFTPSDAAAHLIAPGREWLAELSVLVLELNTPLTSRNTARARQTLHDAIRRVRVVHAGEILVSLGEGSGPLPEELQGVLPVLDDEFPTLVVEGPAEEMGWNLLARLAGPLALAIGRADLADAFRLAFMALETVSRGGGARFERPSDQAVAKALGRPVQRVRELYRSLRSTTDRLLEHLIPVIHAVVGAEVAEALLERAERPMDEADVQTVLQRNGVPTSEIARIITACRDADGLNELRRALGLDLSTFNASLRALPPRWSPLNFDERLRRSFHSRVLERRIDLEKTVRDAHAKAFDAGSSLGSYVADLKLDWLAMPKDWSGAYDEVDEQAVDAAIDGQILARFGNIVTLGEGEVEDVRQANRIVLSAQVEPLRSIVRAWQTKAAGRTAPDWALPADQLLRKVVGSGVLDFRAIQVSAIPKVLAHAGVWPAGMEPTTDLATLGMTQADLQSEKREQEKREQRTLVERRSIKFGTVEVDGGAARPFHDVAAALAAAFEGGGFKARSGQAKLDAFTGGPGKKQPGPGGKRESDTDPTYMSEEQRTLLGFAGELAAYHYLRLTQRKFSEDSWVSSMGRRYLGRSVGPDDDGFDFRIPRFRGEVCFEVKAHTGDPGYVDLERSQVLAAASMAEEVGSRRWGILYVTNVRDPALIAVHELPNPYSKSGGAYFRERQRSGVRLMIKKR